MFRKFQLLCVLCLLAGVAPTAIAQKIGVVDMKAIADRSQKIKAELDRSQDQVRGQQEKLDDKMSQMQKLRQDLNARRSAMNASEINAQEEKLQSMREEFEDMQSGLNRQINQIQRNVLRPQAERIQKIIGEVARQQNLDLVLDAEAAIYHSEGVDITPLVVQIFDRESSGESSQDTTKPDRGRPAVPSAESPKSTDKSQPAKPKATDNPPRANRRGE